MQCISTTSFAVIINGGPSAFFNASRGLRQGDPLSPLIFLMVMEAFNDLLTRAVELQFIRGIRVSRGDNSLEVTHLFYADDTSIFCQPGVDILRHLSCVLLFFQAVSGLSINLSKLEMIRLGDRSDEARLTGVLGCKSVRLPIKYLGLPLGAKFKDLKSWELVVELFERRLAGWK